MFQTLFENFYAMGRMSSVKNIYILLSRPKTFVSRLIAFFTHAEYSHVSVSYDSELGSLYSFARKYPFFPLPGGIVDENENGILRKPIRNARCILLSASVSEDAFEAFRSRIDNMFLNRNKYHYSIRGLLLCRLGIESSYENHYFCSQFAAEMLSCAEVCGIPKPPSLMKPPDFLEISDLECVYSGVLCEYISQVSGGNVCRRSVL